MKLKNILIYLGILVLVVIVLQRCNNDKISNLEGKYSVIEKQSLEADSLYKIMTLKYDSLSKIRMSENNKSKEKVDNLKKDIVKIVKEKSKISEDLKGLISYYNNRYDAVVATSTHKDSVSFNYLTALDMAYDLEAGDRCYEISEKKDSIITEQNFQIVNLEKDRLDLFELNKDNNELTNLAKKQIKNLEKQVKRQKNKNTLNKVLIGAGVVGGFILGRQ